MIVPVTEWTTCGARGESSEPRGHAACWRCIGTVCVCVIDMMSSHGVRSPGVTIGPSAVDVVVRYWHRVGGESMVARRRGSGDRLPLGLVVARQSALRRTHS